MIISVNEANLPQAALIHSVSWTESHRSFCTPAFIAMHTPERQQEYIRGKMERGSRFYMLIEEKPIGIVSVKENLIEDLYILPDRQNRGYGTGLLTFAVGQCTGKPVLWLLENNTNAKRLYLRMGFRETGRRNAITDGLDELELAIP